MFNVHIRRLREKIELDPNRPALLLPVPGVGYRLIERKQIIPLAAV